MPPRTLPWLAAPKNKPHDPLSTYSPAPPKRRRDATPPSDQDLVDTDLNPTGGSTPKIRAKPRLLNPDRSPSTSPPPAPPSVEYMREGYGADDAWMMVEDELCTTAQLYTQHIHHAAYAEQKRRAQARGEKLLRTMGRPTDGRTERNGMVVEREEHDKGIKKALGWDEEDEGDLTDPLLGALLNNPRRMGIALEGVGKVKSKSRAANGFHRSPEKARRTFIEKQADDGEAMNEASDAESDDLDGPAPRARNSTAGMKTSVKPSASTSNPRREAGIFKKFAAVTNGEVSHSRFKLDRPSAAAEEFARNDDSHQRFDAKRTNGASTKNPFTTSIDDFEPAKPTAREETPAYLVKRRQRKEEEEKRKAKEKKAAIEVPTFMF